ncbi:hypothetical protein [Planctomicrobium piriforme]|uniref:hypothetical protein n=1 Tax=Planctomicrobium piriforme TaxID=1576369 RepID=UPI001114039B|nr:hypothetical protein [Planctomicrobium piriforme]
MEVPADAPADKSAVRFQAMERLAQRTTVVILKGEQEVPAVLRAEPLMKYGDETRNIKESTLWAWMDGEQPVAFQKIEVNAWGGTENPSWTFCIASLSDQPLRISWTFRPQPFLTEPLKFVPLETKDALSQTDALLQLQLRSLMRGFAVIEGTGKNILETRLLPQPMLQISDSERGVRGAVFGFAVGTNPDVHLVMRSVSQSGESPRLECGVAKMTSIAVSVKNQDQEIATFPTVTSGFHGAWGFFFAGAKVSD